MRVYLATDHGGFELKNKLVEFVGSLGHEAEDCGAFTNDPNDDYPAIIATAARKLSADAAAGLDSRAVIAGGSGQGEAMVANRFKGVRCAVYYGEAARDQTDVKGKSLDILSSTRDHNNANALSLGLRFLSLEEAKDAVQRWLAIPFVAEERHVRRIKQIDEQN